MIISTRTPEGSPGRCRVCGNDVCMEPSLPAGDATCPHCGSLLWLRPRPRGRRTQLMSSIQSVVTILAGTLLLALACTCRWIPLYWPEGRYFDLALLIVFGMLLFGRSFASACRRL